MLVILCLCTLTAHFRLSSIIHGLTAMASSMIFSYFHKHHLLFCTPEMLWTSFAIPHDSFEKYIISESIVKCHASKHCAKNNIYVSLVLLLRRVRKKHGVKTAASSKTQKSDGSEWWVIIFIYMMCNPNKNSTGLIIGSWGFARCAQFLLATKLVELQPSKIIGSNEPWDIGYLWKPVLYWYSFLIMDTTTKVVAY